MTESSKDVRLGHRAVVIGGSIAGMLAARALSEFFEEVVIIEADDPCNGKNPRKKVPQGHHSHVLLESGQRALNDPWDMATTEALRHPDISGLRPLGTGIKQWLTRKIFQASANKEDIYLLLAQVMNLTQPSSVFFRPSVLRKIFK